MLIKMVLYKKRHRKCEKLLKVKVNARIRGIQKRNTRYTLVKMERSL